MNDLYYLITPLLFSIIDIAMAINLNAILNE